MHELAITENVLRIALDEAEKHDARRIRVIRLRVGKLTQVVPESVEFYLGLLAQNTAAAGAKLEVEAVPVVVKCTVCGECYCPEHLDFGCRRCGEPTDIVSGRELYVDSIELE